MSSTQGMHDVVVVGGGPVGGHVASLVARKGFDVLILEEHGKVGEPVQCAGIFSPKVLELVGCEDAVLNRIRGADVFSPKGVRLELTAKEPKAVVVDRGRFDNVVVERALKDGARMMRGAKALGARKGDNGIDISLLQKGARGNIRTKLRTKLLIGADGVASNVARWSGLQRAPVVLPGVQDELEGVDLEDDRVKIFTGREIAPGFFAWLVPAGQRVRVGLCTRKGAPAYLRRMHNGVVTSKHLEGGRVVGTLGGAIPMGILKRTETDRVMLVGDAAAQVKATSGGGIYPGLVCAGHCAQTAIEALESGDLSERALSSYHDRWTADIGKELRKDWRLYKLYQTFDDAKIEKAFRLLNKPKVLRLIEERGDIDFPSKLALPIARKEPRLLGFATRSLAEYILRH